MTKVAEQNGERVLSSTAMPAVVAGQRITFDEAAQLDADVYPGEIVDGRWQPVSGSTLRHGAVVLEVGTVLKAWARGGSEWFVAVGDVGPN